MWCAVCRVPINGTHKSFGLIHLKSAAQSAVHHRVEEARRRALCAVLPHCEEPPVLGGKQLPLANGFNKRRAEDDRNSDF